MITEEQLAAWRESAEKATPGPWTLENTESDNEIAAIMMDNYRYRIGSATKPEEGEKHADYDAEFIATARAAVPALISEVERLRADAEKLALIELELVSVKAAMACAVSYLWQAHSDIGDWVRLAARQIELLPAGNPARPSPGGMAASDELRRQIALVCADSVRDSAYCAALEGEGNAL